MGTSVSRTSVGAIISVTFEVGIISSRRSERRRIFVILTQLCEVNRFKVGPEWS